MSHQHEHGDRRRRDRRRLAITLGLVVLYMAVEVVGGLITNSLALLADAGHMLSDAGSLALALFALWIAQRPRSPERTFGFHRTEILAALANGVTLVAIAIYILVAAWDRLQTPVVVDGRTMMWIAVGGLVVNLVGMWILHEGREESLNVKGAWLHLVADTLGSLQAIIAGAAIWAFGWNLADAIASILIAILVTWSAWSLLRETVNVLMEGTPRHIDAQEVESALVAVDGVVGIHDLHIWTITSGFESLSVHARVRGRERRDILRELRQVVRERFGIEHSTVQLEEEDCGNGSCCG
ncbi:MAG TPA: cation diffusion facilitator family transporter [Thermoanaerobaculia bacterium]|nr:cation diffusion facilitator family transporter [Thermoanaerobaculia bacterium]